MFLYDNGELGNLSLTGFNVHISRHYSKYLIVYYLPSGLFVVVSWTSFVIPPQVPFFLEKTIKQEIFTFCFNEFHGETGWNKTLYFISDVSCYGVTLSRCQYMKSIVHINTHSSLVRLSIFLVTNSNSSSHQPWSLRPYVWPPQSLPPKPCMHLSNLSVSISGCGRTDGIVDNNFALSDQHF